MAWNLSNVTARVTYTDPTLNVCKRPNTIGMMGWKTFSLYHLESSGRPKDVMATARNNASKVARPQRRLENEPPLWREVLDVLEKVTIKLNWVRLIWFV